MKIHHSMGRSALLLVLVSATAGVASAQSVQANINGTTQTIGNLSASNGYLNNDPTTRKLGMTASLQLTSTYKYLMNDGMGCQFRWFQIVTADSQPPNWMGSAPTVPYVDPPFDGWDYQRNPENNYKTGTPGDDEIPFYENNNEYAQNSETSKDGLGHNETLGITRTADQPGIPKTRNGNLQFQTFLVFVDPAMIAAKTFVPLLGFGWGGGFAGAVNDTNIRFNGPTYITPTQAANNATFVQALNNDGFNGWTPTWDANIDLCQATPEPAPFLALGGALLLCVRRKKRA